MKEQRGDGDPSAAFLFGGGEMGARMRALDWSRTPVGPIEHWPQSLKTVVRIMLDSRYAMWMGWGREFTFFCNDAYLPTVGDKQSWVLGASARDVWAEIWPDIGPRAEHVMRTGTATWDEGLLLFLERSGFPEETYHTFSYSPVYDDDNRVGGMLCVVTEDTERDIGERRLQTLRALSAATLPARDEQQACELAARSLSYNALDLPFVLLYRVEDDGRTARLAARTGLARDSTAAAPLVALAPGAPGEASPWPFAAVLASGEAAVVDDVRSRCGELHAGPWPEPLATAMVLPLSQGSHAERPSGLLVAGVSPRRPFDESYRGFLGLVAGQVAGAIGDARAFADEQRRAEALAELDRSKTLFFSNASHEFRTPLTLMLGPLEDLLARPRELPAAVRDEIAIAHRNGRRLLKLVNTLLDFSRIEAGRVQASYEPADLAQVTAELASVFRSAVERAGLTLAIDCAPLAEPVYVDREMWEKVVLNLLGNAFKFTFEGRISVTLREDGDAALLQVADTGIGIPAEALPHLFDRFFRVEGARGRTQEGTGIGLALVQELVRLHGGSVGAHSTPGRGSVFSVRLPFGRAHLRADRIGAERTLASTSVGVDPFVEEAQSWLRETGLGELEPISAPTPLFDPPAGALQRARLLVADDNADMRGYLRRLLGNAYEVIAVGDGQQALATLRAHAFDLVLSDVMMPRLDGYGLLAALRADPRTASLPVILLSARAGDEARIEGLSAGADDYLTKPFSARELLARVAGTLALARTRREAMRREEALRAERRNVLESMADAFLALDAEWRITYANGAAERIYATPRERLIGRDFWQAFPGLGEGVEAAYRRAMREQTTVRLEHYDEAEGRWFDMQAFAHDGALALFGRDITERKRVDEALRASELRFRRLADSMPQLVFAADADGSFTYMNRYGREFTGTRDEMLGHRRYALLHPDDRERVRETWMRAVREGRPYECESRLRQHDGNYRWVLSRALPVLDDDGKVIEWIGASTDIHELRLAQQALAEADHRKDEFLATLAHELRNPLAPLRNAVHILRRAGDDRALAARVHEMIERQVEHMVRLVDDLMEVSRISSGKIELRRARTDLASVLKSAVEASRPLIERARHTLTLDLPEWPLALDADPVRLAQVFANLLNNAAKFTDEGGRIELVARRDGADVRVSVRDSGVGIAPEMLPQVFEMFAQGRRHGARSQEGLGIGLGLARRLVAMHGGHIEARSEGLGCGSEFVVRLPLAVGTPEPARPVAVVAAGPAARRRVLVVDDNHDAADSLGVLLGYLGAEACVVHDGPAALEALARLRPSLVLLDLGMPGMDGHEVAARMRADPAWDAVRLIALTGWGQEADRERTRREGFDGHLVKPVDVPALQELLAEAPALQGGAA
ncbi:MAG TPA: ATP-binding protein [Burkholderiaceae bacterium]